MGIRKEEGIRILEIKKLIGDLADLASLRASIKVENRVEKVIIIIELYTLFIFYL